MRTQYQGRLAAREAAAARHEAQFRNLGNWRLAVVVAGAFLAWNNYWLLPFPVVIFIALIVRHERVARNAAAERRAAEYYRAGLSRLDHVWTPNAPAGENFRDPLHPYADDLDLFGRGSVFQLMSSARTSAGEATLAEWLKRPATADEVLARQVAVRELAPRLDLREDLALLGENMQANVHPEMLIRWGSQPPLPVPPGAHLIAFVSAAGSTLAFAGYMLQLWSYHPFLVAILAQIGIALWLRPVVRRILANVGAPARDLALISEVLARLEREPFTSPKLTGLRKQLETDGRRPSAQIAQLRTLVETLDWRLNQMFAAVAALFLWTTQFSLAIERWRRRSGPQIGRWLAALGEMEALSSIAGYSAEHPEDAWPELVSNGPLFEGSAVAHPLLARSVGVANDVMLGREPRLFVISGSNMSGKSTLLRAVGLNAVLAWAGAPVRAANLRISPLSVGASLRVVDSLQDGKSRFYAEITRLRQIVDLASGTTPLLFLLDELLSGTNSHDRQIGAAAIVRSLAGRGAIGFVTTHDLALARIADELGPAATNVHFEDHIEDGKIAFDYKLRPGVVRKSNALELMRSVGLEV